MKVLVSSFGSRGDVQPMLALALELKNLGQDVVLCMPPNFQSWAESFDLPFVPGGMDTQAFLGTLTTKLGGRPLRVIRELFGALRDEVAQQFQATGHAARGCDLIVTSGAQFVGGSIAEALKVPHVYTAYCPALLPSAELSPMTVPWCALPRWLNSVLWTLTRGVTNLTLRGVFNAQRAELGLAPVRCLYSHMVTDRPWLAADATLAPLARTRDMRVTQTGAWFLHDSTPLPLQLEEFLSNGEPPLYFGFGSMPAAAPQETSRILIDAARAVGRRAIISQGWANLRLLDANDDCISVGPVAHEKLFPRVAAVVHHGGAGTTSATTRAGRPHVIVPHLADQYYWAHRIRTLGVGAGKFHAGQLTTQRLTRALRECLDPGMVTRATALAKRIELNGAARAAERLVAAFG